MSQRSVSEQVRGASKNVSAERLVLAGLVKYGSEVYYDVSADLKEDAFSHPANRLIYSTIRSLITEEGQTRLDTASILSKIDPGAVTRYQLGEYLTILSGETILPENVMGFAKTVAKLGIRRHLMGRMEQGIKDLEKLDESATITQILATAEAPIAKQR